MDRLIHNVKYCCSPKVLFSHVCLMYNMSHICYIMIYRSYHPALLTCKYLHLGYIIKVSAWCPSLMALWLKPCMCSTWPRWLPLLALVHFMLLIVAFSSINPVSHLPSQITPTLCYAHMHTDKQQWPCWQKQEPVSHRCLFYLFIYFYKDHLAP